MMNHEKLEEALKITNQLLQNKEINSMIETQLYEVYVGDVAIQELVHTILSSYGLTLIEYKKGLYVSPGIDNMLFGYKNEELRQLMHLDTNKELYLCYFIMYTVMTVFYKESAYATYKDYITATEIVDRVTTTLEAIGLEDLEQEEAYSFATIKDFWERLTQISLHQNEENLESLRRTLSQFYFVTRSLHFLTTQGLLHRNEIERNYVPSEKFKALIAHYFDDREVKNALMNYAENFMEKGVSTDAAY